MIDSHWEVKDTIRDDDAYGFIYVILTPDNKYYVGRKNLKKKIRRPPLKGKKRVRVDYVQSDWMKYTSSSDNIKESIKVHGKDTHQFFIIHYAQSKEELNYLESLLIFASCALTDERSYNYNAQGVRYSQRLTPLHETANLLIEKVHNITTAAL